MIYYNNQLITNINQSISELVNEVSKVTEQAIGAVYKGSQLVWLTVYNAIKSCFGSGTWIQDKPWLDSDYWKNN